MYPLLVTAIILLAALENIVPSLVGFFSAPEGFVFLGTVHHPADYFYYVSQFAQHHRGLFVANLYTTESVPPNFVGWINVLLGTVFSALGISPTPAYHISLVLLTVGVLISAYLLGKRVLNSPRAALLGLFLFTLFHAFPVLREGVSSYADYWNNYAVPRVRLGGVPHQLAAAFASFVLVTVLFDLLRSTKGMWRKTAIGMVASGIVGSLQPVLWLLIAGVMGSTVLVAWRRFGQQLASKVRLAVFGITGVGTAAVLLLTYIFRHAPFTQLAAWEATQMTRFTPEHFFLSTGPVFLIALLSLPLVTRQRALPLLFTTLFAVVSYALFLSPIGSSIGISHVRFMSTLAVLSTALVAAYGLEHLIASRVTWLRLAAYAVIVGMTVLILPNHAKTLSLATTFSPNNLYEYLPKGDYALLAGLAAKSTADDTFLLPSPYNTVFPALSGRRSYNGHPLITINATIKDAEVTEFFAPGTDSAAMHAFVTRHGISWIVTPHNPKLKEVFWLREISRSDGLVAYHVIK